MMGHQAGPWLALDSRALGNGGKVPALDHAALKISSECSFTLRKLRFLTDFRLA